MFRNKSVSTHEFSMVPRADIPRAAFSMQSSLKTTFDSGLLIPVMCEEVLPGDSFRAKMTAFVRMATPIYPIMDNVHLESFFFFVPNRLVWNDWTSMMGEREDGPDSSIDYEVPGLIIPGDGAPGGYQGTILDYFGLPVNRILAGSANTRVSALPFRAYNLIWNEWFRDQNLQDKVFQDRSDPDVTYNGTNYKLLRRGKRHDYFTSALPWPQKGDPQTIPITGQAPVYPGENFAPAPDTAFGFGWTDVDSWGSSVAGIVSTVGVSTSAGTGSTTPAYGNIAPANLYANLAGAVAVTINDMRLSFAIQRLLERDARGGTRYTELLKSHFGVSSPDARLQRPEYLGGGHTPVIVNPIAATTGTTERPVGSLGGMATAVAQHGFSSSFVEHGYVIGLISVRADMAYQQGLRRHWKRQTRYDFYWPAFAHLGEQAVSNNEIYYDADEFVDSGVFGYQERWAEYRYMPSQVTGRFRSDDPLTLDAWHLAQEFDELPRLNAAFIEENPPIQRVVAVADEPEFLMDAFFDIRAARPMPLYSVPGMMDHF